MANENGNLKAEEESLARRKREMEGALEELNKSLRGDAQKNPELENNVLMLSNDINELTKRVNEMAEDITAINSRVGDVELQAKKTGEDVYSQLDEVTDLIMMWEKRMAHVEEYLKSLETQDRGKIEELSRIIRNQSSEVKIMKAKQDVLSQLKKGRHAE